MKPSPRRRRVASATLTACLLAVAGCDGRGAGDQVVQGDDETTSTSSTTPGSSTTASTAPDQGSTPPPFDGSTSPTSAPAPASTTAVAHLVDVRVAATDEGTDRVVFEFADGQLPAYDIAYQDPPVRESGSGEPVDVEGEAVLVVRMEGATHVRFEGEDVVETYTGPDRVRGDTEVVTEAVLLGDFEANLEWGVGVRERVPFRVSVLQEPARVVIDLATSTG